MPACGSACQAQRTVTRWGRKDPVPLNSTPVNPDAPPEVKAAEFDEQFAGNKAEGDKRKAEGKYPYDLDKYVE